MSSTSPPVLRLDVIDGQIALVTIDQPGSRANVLSQAVQSEFEALLTELRARSDLQGLILRSGKPGMFIAGADLKEMGGLAGDDEQKRRVVRRGLAIMAGIESLPYPTVAAIEGPCVGGGLELALGFDFRVASTHPKTELGFPEVKIGLLPGWGGTQRLQRVIGPATAAEMILQRRQHQAGAGPPARPDLRCRAAGTLAGRGPAHPRLGPANRGRARRPPPQGAAGRP